MKRKNRYKTWRDVEYRLKQMKYPCCGRGVGGVSIFSISTYDMFVHLYEKRLDTNDIVVKIFTEYENFCLEILGRRYARISYDNKDQAKEHGFKWDSYTKLWYSSSSMSQEEIFDHHENLDLYKFIDVHYAHKDIAKEHGAKFDAFKGSWYIPSSICVEDKDFLLQNFNESDDQSDVLGNYKILSMRKFLELQSVLQEFDEMNKYSDDDN